MRIAFRLALIVAAFLMALVTVSAWASVGGSISGTVKDPSGSVVASASVTVKETSTGLSHQTHTNSKGYYTFPVLPVGHYVLDVKATGFGKYERNEIVLDTNAALTLDALLKVGGVSQRHIGHRQHAAC